MTKQTPHPEPSDAQQRAKLIATVDPSKQPQSAFLEELRSIVEQMEPRGLAPAGNHVISARDMAKALGGAATWFERHRQRFIDAGFLVKAGRRFVGDLSKIQKAIGNPEFWEDAE